MNFRLDINGLRAIAVIIVVLFHLNIPPFSGGFIGVDVFFVISGYLMTSIITLGLESKRFSLYGFYLSRCKRIVPPLVVLCCILMALCFFIIPPDEYKKLSKHVFTSLFFISNLTYYKESGYFDLSSDYKWLLHTWSLSVEWQFYIIFPLALVAIHKFSSKYCKLIILLFTILSFVFSLYLSKKNLSLSYFLFLSRCWEMLCGGCAFYFKDKFTNCKRKYVIVFLSLMAIISSSVLMDESTTWPGILTLIPVLAASAILMMNTKFILLENKVVQKIGSWSYSIYLYHWPLIVLVGVFYTVIDIEMRMALIFCSIFLGWVSYRCVEDKNSKVYVLVSKALYIIPFYIGVVIISVAFFLMSGMPGRVNENVNYISSLSKDFYYKAEKCFVLDGANSPECKFGVSKDDEDVDLVVIGDSHAYATLSAVLASNENASVVFIAQSSCPAVPDIVRIGRPHCGSFMRNGFSAIKTKYKNAKVLIVNRFSQYIHGENGDKRIQPQFYFKDSDSNEADFFEHFTRGLLMLGPNKDVYILSPIPDYPYDVVFMSSRYAMVGSPILIKVDISTYRRRSEDIDASLKLMSSNNNKIHILYPSAYLCDNEYCYGSLNGVPIYRDSNHLTNTGNKVLVDLFKKIWQ
ncbi:acyltransferase family protein [Kluyvera sp. STS39-E]|uniref:acyltransferase family protein n=1 Tax=Kluyvera sp. STS39-E TaxID=3234748 RepID=UPI0034C626F3